MKTPEKWLLDRLNDLVEVLSDRDWETTASNASL